MISKNFNENLIDVAVGQSKASTILFGSALIARSQNDFGADKFKRISLLPRGIKTEMGRDLPGWLQDLMSVVSIIFKSVPQGAATLIYGVVSRDLKGGEYLDDCNVGNPTVLVQDPEIQKKLFEFSENVTGIKYEDVIQPAIQRGVVSRIS